MHHKHIRFILAFGSAVGLSLTQVQAADGQLKTQAKTAVNSAQVDTFINVSLLEGLKSGIIDAKAVGTGDGRMTISVQNKTNRRLRVILPPGLIASGASGQMGGMGGGMGVMDEPIWVVCLAVAMADLATEDLVEVDLVVEAVDLVAVEHRDNGE